MRRSTALSETVTLTPVLQSLPGKPAWTGLHMTHEVRFQGRLALTTPPSLPATSPGLLTTTEVQRRPSAGSLSLPAPPRHTGRATETYLPGKRAAGPRLVNVFCECFCHVAHSLPAVTVTPPLSHLLCHTSSVTPPLSHLLCHTSSVTPTLSHLLCHTSSVTPPLSHPFCHTSSVTPTLSHPFCHTSSVTSPLSHLLCHTSSVTPPLSHLFCHITDLTQSPVSLQQVGVVYPHLDCLLFVELKIAMLKVLM